MAINHGVDALLRHFVHGQLVDFGAGSSGASGAKGECVLNGVHIFHGGLESSGRLRFTGLQDVGHLLPIGIEAHVR